MMMDYNVNNSFTWWQY